MEAQSTIVSFTFHFKDRTTARICTPAKTAKKIMGSLPPDTLQCTFIGREVSMVVKALKIGHLYPRKLPIDPIQIDVIMNESAELKGTVSPQGLTAGNTRPTYQGTI